MTNKGKQIEIPYRELRRVILEMSIYLKYEDINDIETDIIEEKEINED